MAKDLFSEQSKCYAQYRPDYPPELFEYLLQYVNERKQAWDCATGNGQAAAMLANYFESVKASDISEAQLQHAIQKSNIEYVMSPAEKTPFADNSFDLITVAQAYHWLNWTNFHAEAVRVGKAGAVVSIWTYNTVVSDSQKLNDTIQHFYHDITGPYWEYERKYIDEAYANVEFEFDPLPTKTFNQTLVWTKEQLLGFFESWSAVRKYIKVNSSDPVDLIRSEIDASWGDITLRPMRFPIHVRLGRIGK